VLYDQLLRYERTPVVELNRAVAVSFAVSPVEALELLDSIERTGALERYAPFHLARADMFRRLGSSDEAGVLQGRAAVRSERAGPSVHREAAAHHGTG
jgi:predicted RNA polymerase sigma factor